MVCRRCKMIVKSELEQLGLHVLSVELGEVDLIEDINNDVKMQISHALHQYGFELIDDKKSRLIEKIKNYIIELVHNLDSETKLNISEYLTQKLNHDYSYLSNLFTEVEGTTIEQFCIAQKIERVKELLMYDELSLSEISFKLNYSSVAHLSNQFKKVTGLSPSHFKQLKVIKRKSLEEI